MISNRVRDLFCERVRGAVYWDQVTRHAYATDASIYRYLPLAVVEPVDREDMRAVVQVCAEHALPLIVRGGGTSLVGQAVGHGVVMDVSRHCTRILEFNPAERWIRVEPGIVRDELNRFLYPHGLHFATDPATTSRATIGGMIANNAAGMRSIKYGMTIDHVHSLDLLLADGEVVHVGPIDFIEQQSAQGPNRARLLGQAVARIVDREHDEIRARYPQVGRHSGGYALDALVDATPLNLAKIIVGSEGTLGVVSAATLQLEPLPKHSGLCLAHFSTLGDCLRSVESIVKEGATAVELLDGTIMRMAREHPATRHTCTVIEGRPEGLLVIEVQDQTRAVVADRLNAIQAHLRAAHRSYAAPIMWAHDDRRAVWNMREGALGLIATTKDARKPVPYIEDAAVPLAVLADYVEEVLAVCAGHQQPVALFGHAGAGVLHIRPMHDLRDPADRAQLLAIQDEVFALVKKYGGAWSGEHGDGIIRGHYNRLYFGDRLYQTFREIKQLFDPAGRLNPGKVLDTPPRDTHLRLGADVTPPTVATAFRWQEEGGLRPAVEQCTGVGACRQVKAGVMCPSYMATRDERHSTRGRANVLREALSGALGPAAMSREDVWAVFDLCVACKGCKSECPNQVDVGKMKAELQHQYYQHHHRPWRDHIMARVGTLGRWQAGWPAPLANALLASRPVRWGLDRGLGIDKRRRLPCYAGERLSAWFKRRGGTRRASGRPVVLMNDLYMEFQEPEIGQAVVDVLEQLGYAVELPGPVDSQRPALSQGMLDRARRNGGRTIQQLLPYAQAGKPILVVEPSCATALLDDLPDLVDDAQAASVVARNTVLIEDFLVREWEAGHLQWPPATGPATTVFFHPHCHQRALNQGRSTQALLKALPGVELIVSAAGCCGMAGAFGYEREHYEWSVKMAQDRLLPAIESLTEQTVILASGFSCRHQIADLARRPARHPLVWLADWLK